MTTPADLAFARRVLAVDALTCAAAGALMAGAAGPLSGITALPAPLLLAAGASLFPVAALFAWMSRTRRLGAFHVRVAVLGNAAWVAASLAVLALTQPNPLGYAFVLGQAGAVTVLALVEAAALRRPRAPALA
ncbi:hypothetical protein [Phenylobacterium sp.]|jgi:hypothetical protein|uniref:hypothetical protein n=1 Tax=Phenylobacterium sp. TaxID=1871053 RepID=UPI002F95D694